MTAENRCGRAKNVMPIIVVATPLILLSHYYYHLFNPTNTPEQNLDPYLWPPVLSLMFALPMTACRHYFNPNAGALSAEQASLLQIEQGNQSAPVSQEASKKSDATKITETKATQSLGKRFLWSVAEVVYRLKTPVLIFGGGGYFYAKMIAPYFVKSKLDPRLALTIEAELFLPTLWALKLGLLFKLKWDRCFNPGRDASELVTEIVKVYVFQGLFCALNALFYSLPDFNAGFSKDWRQESMLYATIATIATLAAYACIEKPVNSGLAACATKVCSPCK